MFILMEIPGVSVLIAVVVTIAITITHRSQRNESSSILYWVYDGSGVMGINFDNLINPQLV
jgi:hypothetical protein